MAFVGRFLGSVFTNLKAWLAALLAGGGIALVEAVRQYLAALDVSDPDVISAAIKSIIITALFKLLALTGAFKVAGAVVRAASPPQ